YYFGLGQVLSLDNLKMQRDRLHGFYEHHAVEMSLGFILVYILVAGLSLPGATILTLGGGAIFGSVMGTLFVNIGATLGATIAFLAARFLLRDWVEGKFGERLQAFNQGFSRSALNYLLFLRLVPLFPFFVVNLVSGLTRIPLRTYFFGTMFGILPGTFVYANAGSNLAAINSLSDIASPGMLGAFALLGCFALVPTLYRKFKNRKTPAPATDL
ncbi:MAG: TVP38/TMEM64 family protein, partial [Nitrospinae bacterium CG11_big_fil_rev_8_21_14_0_20_56_8]